MCATSWAAGRRGTDWIPIGAAGVATRRLSLRVGPVPDPRQRARAWGRVAVVIGHGGAAIFGTRAHGGCAGRGDPVERCERAAMSLRGRMAASGGGRHTLPPAPGTRRLAARGACGQWYIPREWRFQASRHGGGAACVALTCGTRHWRRVLRTREALWWVGGPVERQPRLSCKPAGGHDLHGRERLSTARGVGGGGRRGAGCGPAHVMLSRAAARHLDGLQVS